MRVTSTSRSSSASAVSFSSTLRRGESSADVRELQQALAREGFDPGSSDGKFGANTERAVRAFQRANGLEVDGVVGTHTRAALRGTSAPSTPSAPSQPAPTPSGDPGDVTTGRSRTASIGGVNTFKVSGKDGVAFKGGMSINADGSPHAYHPKNTGLDSNANAGKPGNWWGVATDKSGKPFVQGPNDPAPGYYVSTTSLIDGRFKANDPRRYANSETVPFIAIPPELRGQGVKLGDVLAVRNEKTGKTVFAIVADVGPKGHLGEGSIKLAEELGINANARRGGARNGVSYVVFPNSKLNVEGIPTHEQIQAAGRQLYDAWGGDAQLASATR